MEIVSAWRVPEPRFVTFTGVDEWADAGRMREISARYPVEWGVLIGGRAGKARYPGLKAFFDILDIPDLRLSLHMCGSFALAVNEGKAPPLPYERFARIQVNRSADGLPYDLHALQAFSHRIGKPVIFQVAGDFPEPASMPMQSRSTLQPLFDRSGGKGQVSHAWPAHAGEQLVGYAGGITPDNVERMAAMAKAPCFWIDMETGIRSRPLDIGGEDTDRLDLGKCEAVCRNLWPAI